MSLVVPPQQSPARGELLKPANLKLGKRASQQQIYNKDSCAIFPTVEQCQTDTGNCVCESESEYSLYEEPIFQYGQELQSQLQDVLESLACLKNDRNYLRGQVADLEKALFAEIESAQETLCFMDNIYGRLETQYVKLSHWNTVLGLGASLIGLTCVFLVQNARQ